MATSTAVSTVLNRTAAHLTLALTLAGSMTAQARVDGVDTHGDALPILESVEIYTMKIRPGVYLRTLDFHACKETTEADWTLDYRLVDIGEGLKNAVLSVRPKAPLNCPTLFRTEHTYPMISIDLSQYPDLNAAFKVVVLNPSEVSLEYDDWD
jgi:hypothetical protein